MKTAYSIIALLVFASSTFAIAPMAFCRMEVEEPTSCCEQPAKETTHCDDSHATCPICSYDLCKVDPSPAKPVVPSTDTPINFVTISVVTVTHDHAFIVYSPPPQIIDSGPAIYLRDCFFRI